VPAITRVLETALYVDDLDRAASFYRDTLGLSVIASSPRLSALDAGQSTVLLLFQRGATANGVDTPVGWMPPHDSHGPAHFAFAVPATDLAAWDAHLQARGVAVESRIEWPAGGQSLYFRDPDGHSVELATPGIWSTY
jgi:catechol 2,3-dioxygenase-like lactoylglutathione lyase family enzyme